MSEKDVIISVVVAVYNREKFLDRCIDSLVFQTFSNIEIILVDDYSTDKSWEIMGKWYSRFPKMIRVIKSIDKGVAHAKNTGVRASRGKYVTFVDSDDYVDYKMFSWLYDCARKNNFPELIHSPIWFYSSSKRVKRCTLVDPTSTEDFLKSESFYLHGKLIRSDVFARFGLFPLLSIGSDDTWLFPVISYLQSISYCSAAGYHYELQDDSICQARENYQKAEDCIKGYRVIVDNTNPKYRDKAVLYAFGRLIYHANIRPIFRKLFLDATKKYWSEVNSIENSQVERLILLKKYNSLWNNNETKNLKIPSNIYVNGFDKDINEQDYYNVISNESKVLILSEGTCDFTNCPDLVIEGWKLGEIEFVSKYFGLKACYEQGGIFVDNTIEIDMPFDQLQLNESFWGFETDDSFTDKVFGGCKGSIIMERILRTYSIPNLYDNPFTPLSSRIKTVLIGFGNIKMCSDFASFPHYGFCLYPVDMFVYSLPYAEQNHVCHYKSEAFNKLECINTPVSVLKSLSDRRIRLNDELKRIIQLQKDRDWLKNKANRLQGKVGDLEKDRDWLKNKANRLQGKVEDLEKDRDWLKNKVNRLQGKVEDLEKDRDWLKNQMVGSKKELSEYQSSFLVRIAWKIHCIFYKIYHNFIKTNI